MYRFIIKMLSHSSKQQNVCTHTHPNGHARKCCQITLVHTHGHTRGATLVLTVQRGHAQAHLGSLYIRRATSSSRAAAHRAHGAFQCYHTHTPQKATSELLGLRRPPPPLLPTAAGARRQQQALAVEEVFCALGDQWRCPRRSIGHRELHLRAATEHP